MTQANSPSIAPQTIGILGGGQLAMMLAEAAIPLGFRCVFLEDSDNCPASLYGQVFKSDELEAFIQASDVFTLEFENTPTKTVEKLAKLSSQKGSNKFGMFPPPIALDIAQDRLKEKRMFNELAIQTVPFEAVSSLEDLQSACQNLGLPIVLKTSRGGYDGKGQVVVRTESDIANAWEELKDAVSGNGQLTSTPAPLIAEGFVHFSREVSIIAARDQNGAVRCYDLVENHHFEGILAKTQAPAVGTSHLIQPAQTAISKIMAHLDYVGVLALELFVAKDERGNDYLVANEIAPRVHNSGHWSIEGAITSQFENHIRAVAGLPLGDTDNVHPSIMINVIGQYPDTSALLAIDSVHYHSYHKTEREGRKIAHITVMPNDVCDLEPALSKIIAVLPNKVGLDKTVTPAATSIKNVSLEDNSLDNSALKNNALADNSKAEIEAVINDTTDAKAAK